MSYEYHKDVLSIPARLLYDELGLISFRNYLAHASRGKLRRTKEGRGAGNEAFVAFDSLPDDFKEVVQEAIGPAPKAKFIIFEDYIHEDGKARKFYEDFTTDTNDPLPEDVKKKYQAEAEIFNAITAILATTMSKRRALGTKVKAWAKITEIVKTLPKHKYPHTLPSNERRLRDKYNRYVQEGYQSLVHSGYGSKNAERLNDEGKSWVLARWSDRIKKCTNYAQLLREYNEMAVVLNWKTVTSEQTLINFLTDPKIEPLWHGFRYGSLKSKEKHMYQHTTKLPSMRDSLWYSDGTKLNYYYQYRDKDGKFKIGTVKVYEVFDTYSEVFLGYHISDSEDFEAQYYAFKMALQISGHKPFEIKFDNQGGTKKLEARSFLSKISKITRNTAPYNGKSKTIENAFGRFQQQFLKQDWFFTGQNIQAKKAESKVNMENITANKHSLPTLEEVKEVYAQRRKEWNESKHPKSDKSRLEVYLDSQNPATPEVHIWDMMDLFWIKHEKPVTCTPYGIKFRKNNAEYNYMVYDADRLPDIDWLVDNIDKKFIVSYDPEDMSIVQLFEDTPLGLRKVCMAETKIEIHRNAQEQEEWEDSFIKQIEQRNKQKQIELRDAMVEIQEKHGRSAEDYGMIEPPILGIESSRKAKKNKAKQIKEKSVGQYLKDLSNADESEVNAFEIM